MVSFWNFIGITFILACTVTHIIINNNKTMVCIGILRFP